EVAVDVVAHDLDGRSLRPRHQRPRIGRDIAVDRAAVAVAPQLAVEPFDQLAGCHVIDDAGLRARSLAIARRVVRVWVFGSWRAAPGKWRAQADARSEATGLIAKCGDRAGSISRRVSVRSWYSSGKHPLVGS